MWTVVDGPVSECTYPKSLEMRLESYVHNGSARLRYGGTEGTNFCSEVI
jgi:hypothetical protein